MSAWKEFRRGKRKKTDVLEFEFNLEDNLFALHQELIDKTYQPEYYTAFLVHDPKLRLIHKATVRDRVLHQAVFRVLYPIFDKNFIFDSYSCRVEKGTHRGVTRLENFARKVSQNHRVPAYALKCDVKKFFASIDQNILLGLIEQKVIEPNVIWLIKLIIKSYETISDIGLPLGNVTSQLFANIYLNELDQFVKHELKQKYYLRYCDDFIILDQDREKLENLIVKLEEFLAQKLNLTLHPDKITIRKTNQGIDFLGYVALPYYRVLRTRTKNRILRKIRKSKISEASRQAYLGILEHCYGYKVAEQIKLLKTAK